MRRRKLSKFIPDRDTDFALTGTAFAMNIARDPGRFYLTHDAADEMVRAMKAFRDALCVAIRPTRQRLVSALQKNDARAKAEAIIRKYGRIARADDRIAASDKIALRIRQRVTRLKTTKCPTTVPVLNYLRSESYGGDGSGVHVINVRGFEKFTMVDRPDGAARLELFVELVPPGQAIPNHPGVRPWYLRSFNRFPMKVKYPVPSEPMLVVYWGRWASPTGDVGPLSMVCMTRVEGWVRSEQSMRITQAVHEARRIEQQTIASDRQLEQVRSTPFLLESAGEAGHRLEATSTTTTLVVDVMPKQTAEVA